MAMVGIGDLARSFLLRQQNTRIKGDLHRLTAELASGTTADLGGRTGGDFAPLAGIERSITRLQAFRGSIAEGARRADAMQVVLGSVSDRASTLAPTLLQTASSGTRAGVDAVGVQAQASFASAVSQLNTRTGERSLLAGVAIDGPALAPAETILSALSAAIGGQTDAAGVAQAVDAWFDDPAGFASVGYLGADQPPRATRTAEGETVANPITAMDPALRDTLKGMAMAALLAKGALAGNTTERAALAARAGERLISGAPKRAALAATLGTAQQRFEAARVRNAAQDTALQTARGDILGVDPYDTATRLQDSQTRLETLYTLTARLSQLSLARVLG